MRELMTDQETIEKWRTWIESFVISDVRKTLAANNLEVGPYLLVLAGIDCLGGYLAGYPLTHEHTTDHDSFKRFIKAYFPPAYHPHRATFWKLRNALLHDYVVPGNVLLRGDTNAPHLTPCKYRGKTRIWINRSRFMQDFLDAWEKYEKDTHTKSELRAKILRRIGRRGFLNVVDVPCE
jgi:hypothetical protein